MGQVVANASMSLDGYIARADNTIGHLFDWFDNGDHELSTISPDITLHLSAESHAYFTTWMTTIGALICGRTLFDFTDGWDGRHTMDVPVVVVTHEPPHDWIEEHPDAQFTFVTDVRDAVARAPESAGDRTVAVTAGTIARQLLELGLLDAVNVDLVPVVMGEGRPFFGALAGGDILLGDPTACTVSGRVTHLTFPVVKS